MLVRLHGELDVETSPLLRSALAPLLHRRIELDLANVTFIDSSGVNVLMAHNRHCQLAGGQSTVIPPGRGLVTRVVDASIDTHEASRGHGRPNCSAPDFPCPW
ncbi:STAS domain-containing protein [Streptomyces sp. TLI_146]|uniref:STAS domain-containing protein n=1 Tax=Streptomyces sp. TLI_146 TaxID=1938858 RepID=UPI0015D57CA4|nr:STAS domain-containing protein [Streptomyces sp. TLI_146]